MPLIDVQIVHLYVKCETEVFLTDSSQTKPKGDGDSHHELDHVTANCYRFQLFAYVMPFLNFIPSSIRILPKTRDVTSSEFLEK